MSPRTVAAHALKSHGSPPRMRGPHEPSAPQPLTTWFATARAGPPREVEADCGGGAASAHDGHLEPVADLPEALCGIAQLDRLRRLLARRVDDHADILRRELVGAHGIETQTVFGRPRAPSHGRRPARAYPLLRNRFASAMAFTACVAARGGLACCAKGHALGLEATERVTAAFTRRERRRRNASPAMLATPQPKKVPTKVPTTPRVPPPPTRRRA